MRIRSILGLAALISTLYSAGVHAALSDFAGNWRNADTASPAITRLQVNVSGDGVTVHAWGKCHPQDCDWGTVRAYAYAPAVNSAIAANARAVSAVFGTGFSATLLVLHSQRADRLRVELYTRFTDNSGRSNYTRTERFVRQGRAATGGTATAQLSGEDCIAFNYRRARVQRIDGHWKITVGKMWLKDFGSKEAEARQGLRILRHYRMDKQCFVGRPHPSMEYYLSRGRSPGGALRGEDCVTFKPARIQVSRVNGHWKIVDGSHWLLDFGAKEAEARQAHGILRHYGFTHSCFVGRPNPSMTYFRR